MESIIWLTCHVMMSNFALLHAGMGIGAVTEQLLCGVVPDIQSSSVVLPTYISCCITCSSPKHKEQGKHATYSR